jgi:hypothetical protein
MNINELCSTVEQAKENSSVESEDDIEEKPSVPTAGETGASSRLSKDTCAP